MQGRMSCNFFPSFSCNCFDIRRQHTECIVILPWVWIKEGMCSHVWSFIWTASSEFDTYHLCEQRWFRRACASAQSRQNLRCSLIQAVSQEEPSDRKSDPWPLWMAGHAQLKFVMTECSKTQIRLTGLISYARNCLLHCNMYWVAVSLFTIWSITSGQYLLLTKLSIRT